MRLAPFVTLGRWRSTGPPIRGDHHRARIDPVGIGAVVFILVVAVIALAAPFIAPADPTHPDFGFVYQPTGSEALLGTDGSGRDILSRVLVGARTSLIGPLLVVLIATVAGTAVALVSVLRDGWLDTFLSRVLDIGFAFPGLLVAILATAIFGPGLTTATLALAVAYIPYIGRIVRSALLAETAKPYPLALRSLGLSEWAVGVRHLLPAVLPTVLAQATVSFGYAMVDLAALSFLGLGVQSPAADWGLMVSEGQRGLLQGYWEESAFAGAAIVLTVASFSIVGDRLADRFAPVRS